MKVYQIKTSNNTLYGTFQSFEKAKEQLKVLADERKNRFGVRCFEMDDTSFSFLLGWEEAEVRFSIVEIEVKE